MTGKDQNFHKVYGKLAKICTKIFTLVKPLWLQSEIYFFKMVFEDWDCSRDTDPRMANVVLKEVGSDQLLVSRHPDGNDLVDELVRNPYTVQISVKRSPRLPVNEI